MFRRLEVNMPEYKRKVRTNLAVFVGAITKLIAVFTL